MYGFAQQNDAMLASIPGATAEDSVRDVMRIVDSATRDTVGGKFMDVSGNVNDW